MAGGGQRRGGVRERAERRSPKSAEPGGCGDEIEADVVDENVIGGEVEKVIAEATGRWLSRSPGRSRSCSRRPPRPPPEPRGRRRRGRDGDRRGRRRRGRWWSVRWPGIRSRAAEAPEVGVAKVAEVEELVADPCHHREDHHEPSLRPPAGRGPGRGCRREDRQESLRGSAEFEQHVSTRSALAFWPRPCAALRALSRPQQPSVGPVSSAHGSGRVSWPLADPGGSLCFLHGASCSMSVAELFGRASLICSCAARGSGPFPVSRQRP